MSHPSVIQYRRDLHQIPELDRELPETTAYLQNVLSQHPCRLFSPAEGALCAYFDAGRPDTAAFRADMDALPVEEAGDNPFRSRHPGKMHACGHDGHMAMVLSLADAVAARREPLEQNVLLIFQPAEETTGGAADICRSGVLEEYCVRRVFGIHIWPGLPAGSVWTRPGPMMAKNSEVDLLLTGRSAHIARAEEGIDALWWGAEWLRRVYAMAEGELPASELRVLRFGQMESGTVRNAISAQTVLRGSLRVFSMETFHFLCRRIRELGEDIARESGCRTQARFSAGYPPVTNDPALVEAVCRHLGAQAPAMLEAPALTAEDFSFYQQRVPGTFFFLGAGDVPPLHAADFHFDEAILERGVELYRRLLDLTAEGLDRPT